MKALSVQHLNFSFDHSSNVLSGLDLHLAGGHSALIVGDNGSGKPTLGRLLSGILTPTAGTIEIDGRSPTSLPIAERCRQVSYVGQVTHLAILTESIYSELCSFGVISSASAIEDAYLSWAR